MGPHLMVASGRGAGKDFVGHQEDLGCTQQEPGIGAEPLRTIAGGWRQPPSVGEEAEPACGVPATCPLGRLLRAPPHVARDSSPRLDGRAACPA